MNKLGIAFMVLVLLAILSLTFISPLQQSIIKTNITIDYVPASNCSTNCSSGNCTSFCSGVLTIVGENLLNQYSLGSGSIHETLPYAFQRDLGNESDISDITGKLGFCLGYQDNYTNCIIDKSNVSTQYGICLATTVGKDNYTGCLNEAQACQSNLQTANKDLDDTKNQKWWFGGIGLIVGIIGVRVIYPYIQGKKTPTDETEKYFPSRGYS